MRFADVFKTACFVLAVLVYLALCNYIDQQRFVTVGFCPPGASGPGPGIMVMDQREGGVYCVPIPLPPQRKDTIMPPSPSELDRRPKIGV